MLGATRCVSTKCGILRHIPLCKRNEIITELEHQYTTEKLCELDYGIYSDVLIDIYDNDNNGTIFKSLINRFSYKNTDGINLEVLPPHIEHIIKTNFIVRKLYQLQYIFPDIEMVFSKPVGTSRYHVRLRNISDFKRVRELEKKQSIPEYNYRPVVGLTYFDHSKPGKVLYNLLTLKSSDTTIGSGLNNVDWKSFSLLYDVDILKKSNNIVILSPKSSESYYRLISLDPNSPRTPFICSPLLVSNNTLSMGGGYFSSTDHYNISLSISTPNDNIVNDIKSEFGSYNIDVVSPTETTSSNNIINTVIKQNDYFDGVHIEPFTKKISNNILRFDQIYIPLRPYITNNIIQIYVSSASREYFKQSIEPTISNYCWKHTVKSNCFTFYFKSYDHYVNFYVENQLRRPMDYLTSIYNKSLKLVPFNLTKCLYPIYNSKCFTITMPDITRESIRAHLPSFEFESIYISDLNENNICKEFAENNYESAQNYQSICNSTATDDYSPSSNLAFVKLKNTDDAEKLIFLNGKNDIYINEFSIWKLSQNRSTIPAVNEFIIDGISPNVTLTEIRRWLKDVETNTILRDNSLVRVFLSDSLQIIKLLQHNFTTVDNNFITIYQSTIGISEHLSGIVVHCFVKDISQESFEALLDWANGVNVRSYAISPDFENCILLKVNPADFQCLLYRSGSKDYMGNEIFLRYAPKRYEKDIVFNRITEKIDDINNTNNENIIPSNSVDATASQNFDQLPIAAHNPDTNVQSTDDFIV